MNSEPFAAELRSFGRLNVRGRLAALTMRIGPRTDDPLELHDRALLITALRAAKLWPPSEVYRADEDGA